MRQSTIFVVSFFTLILLGCGSSETAREVSGKVTFRNQPLPLGAVVFVPEKGRPEPPAPIKEDGTYTVKLAPGRYRVGVIADRATSDKPMDPEDPICRTNARINTTDPQKIQSFRQFRNRDRRPGGRGCSGEYCFAVMRQYPCL